MDTSHSDTKDTPPAVLLGEAIRQARLKRGLTIAQLAEAVGRPREWLNRVELGYSQDGEHKPPSAADLEAIMEILRESLNMTVQELCGLREQSENDFNSFRRSPRNKRILSGKLTQTEVIIGEANVTQAIVNLINEQHSEAIIRNTGIKGLGSYLKLTPDWKRYREALGEFLTKYPNAVFKRVEYAANKEQLGLAKQADARLAGTREINEVHNAKVKFLQHNPLLLHVLIGQREAILALPQTSGQAGSSIALLVRDKLFVEALRVWYDEVLWEAPGPSRTVQFNQFDESFEEIRKMYGF